MQPVAFTNQSGDSVAYDTVADLLADRNTKTILIHPVFSHIEYEITICTGFSFLI